MHDSTEDTWRHIGKVRERLIEVQQHLVRRGLLHDMSKLEEPEKSGYDQLTVRLADVEYGTDEYRAALADAKPTIDHHYAHNSHHPEHYSKWLPTGRRPASAPARAASLRAWHTIRRAGASASNLFAIIENTVRELGW